MAEVLSTITDQVYESRMIIHGSIALQVLCGEGVHGKSSVL